MSAMANLDKTIEMGRRVGLSKQLSIKIYYIGLRAAARSPRATMYGGMVDMVAVACAVKYTALNRHLLKEEYRYL